MVPVGWSPEALADLREIQEYIGRDSKEAALAMARLIRASVRRLSAFPESGRTVPELGQPYREVIVGRYRVVYTYRPERNRVRVLGVVHASRLMPPFTEDN